MTRFRHPVKRHARAGNGAQQVSIVVIAIASLLGLGAVGTDQYLAASSVRPGARTEPRKGDDIYTGSILYVPDTGNVCHRWQFDNRNGQFNDKGAVNCGDVADQELDGPKNLSWPASGSSATGSAITETLIPQTDRLSWAPAATSPSKRLSGRRIAGRELVPPCRLRAARIAGKIGLCAHRKTFGFSVRTFATFWGG